MVLETATITLPLRLSRLATGLLTQGVGRPVRHAMNQGVKVLVLILDHHGWHAAQVQDAAALLVDAATRAVDVLDVQVHVFQAMREPFERRLQDALVVLVVAVSVLAASEANRELHGTSSNAVKVVGDRSRLEDYTATGRLRLINSFASTAKKNLTVEGTVDWLNYHQLLNFWLVAREGSVQRASEMLHVTPSSVSIQIRQLERSFGAKLFKKQGRGLVLTEIGHEVAGYAGEIFAKGRELMELVKRRPVGRPVELRVGVRDVMPKMVAYQLLKPALEVEESVRLVCQEGEMAQLISDLAIHKLDVVLSDIALDPLYKVQAYSHRLGESDVVVVGTGALAKRYRRGFPSSLDGAPFVLPTENSVLRRQMERWFSDLNLTPRVCGEFADSAMMKIAGFSGLGLLAVPEIIAEEVRKIYGLHRVGVAAGVQEQFYAVSVERRIKHPGVLAIREQAHIAASRGNQPGA